MSNQDNAPVSPMPDDAVKTDTASACDRQLDGIIAELGKIDQCRKRQSIVSFVGIIAILAILLLFLSNLYNFAVNYDGKALGAAIAANGKAFAESASTQAVITGAIDNFKAKFIPAYREALQKQFQSRSPEIQAMLDKEIAATEQYLNVELTAKLEKRLNDAAGKVVRSVSEKYSRNGVDAATVEAAMSKFSEKFAASMAEQVARHIASAHEALAGLNDDFNALENTPEYRSLEGQPVEEVESKLMEALLVRCVYEVNPERGEKTASGNGEI